MRNGYRATRRQLLLGGTAALISGRGMQSEAAEQAPRIKPCPPQERRVGLAYSLWHKDEHWQEQPPTHRPWGTPELGFYRSSDPRILNQHATWLAAAGVDFVYLDWSNDIGMDVRRSGGPETQRAIETASVDLFGVWAKHPHSPRVALMIGTPGDPDPITDGKLSAKANEVHDLFVADSERSGLLQFYLGKPLLLVYVNTPTPWPHGLPPWHDDRFTVRFMTGFVTQQSTLQGLPGISRYGYWSWEDRRQPTYSVFDGRPECMTVVAAWRGDGTPGRDRGQTYAGQWDYARKIGPRFVLAGTFNEWWAGEQIDADHGKDVEPSREFGSMYMDILRQQATLFKEGR